MAQGREVALPVDRHLSLAESRVSVELGEILDPHSLLPEGRLELRRHLRGALEGGPVRMEKHQQLLVRLSHDVGHLDGEAGGQLVGGAPVEALAAVLPLHRREERGLRHEGQQLPQAVRQLGLVRQPLQRPTGRRQAQILVVQHQLPSVPRVVRLRPPVPPAGQQVVQRIVGDADVEHDHVRTIAEPLVLEHEQLLVGAVALDGEIDDLVAIAAVLEQVGERVVVARAKPEGDRVAEHQQPCLPRRSRVGVLGASIATPVHRGRHVVQQAGESGSQSPAVALRVHLGPARAVQVVRIETSRHELRDDQQHGAGQERDRREQQLRQAQSVGEGLRRHAISATSAEHTLPSSRR